MTYTQRDRETKRRYYMAHKLEINDRTNKYWDKNKDRLNKERNLKRRRLRLETLKILEGLK